MITVVLILLLIVCVASGFVSGTLLIAGGSPTALALTLVFAALSVLCWRAL